MAPNLPLCCPRRAFGLLSEQLSSINSPDALLNGAVAIAMHHEQQLDPCEVDARIQELASIVRGRVRGQQPQALIAHLHDVLFDEMGFIGNTDDYYNVANSYLPSVLESKRGLPITLSLIYKLVAERLGIRAWGIGLPGHFITAVNCDGGMILIDAFAGGRIITPLEAQKRLEDSFGPEVQWTDEMLRPASNRHWLTRILQNLLNVFGDKGRYADVAAILEMEMLLWPEQQHLQRDLGLVLARCGMAQPACLWLDRYLQSNPNDPQQPQLRELLQVLAN